MLLRSLFYSSLLSSIQKVYGLLNAKQFALPQKVQSPIVRNNFQSFVDIYSIPLSIVFASASVVVKLQ